MRGVRFYAGAICVSLALLSSAPGAAQAAEPAGVALQQASTSELARQLQVGDVVFTRIPAYPFRQVAATTSSWTNHVGIVIDTSGAEPMVGESKFPLSQATPLSRFVARSEDGRVAVGRLDVALTPQQRQAIKAAAERRFGVFYDTGFNLHSNRQFCSRYVREVVQETTGIGLGQVENFAQLLASNPDANVSFWRAWYFGNIPWQRQTVTPASLLRSPRLKPVFDGYGAV